MSCMRYLPGNCRRSSRLGHRRQIGTLLCICLIHARGDALPGQFLGEHFSDERLLVGVVDLITAHPAADPCLGHTLRITDGNTLVLESEITRRRSAGIEVL